MQDIDLEIRLLLLRARPGLSPARADSLIRSVASDCLDIRDEGTGSKQAEFFTFSHVDGAALVVIFRESEVEFLAFAADEGLNHEAGHFALVEVDGFLQMARSRFRLPDAGFVLPISKALPWMEQHRQGN